MADLELEKLLIFIIKHNLVEIEAIQAQHISKIEKDWCPSYECIAMDVIAQRLLPPDIQQKNG